MKKRSNRPLKRTAKRRSVAIVGGEKDIIRSRKELEEASEKAFCESFLIPLFKAMGFRDVVYYHGGSLELGKDLVMWKPGPFSPRVNYAVVAKAQRITGNVAMQAEVLIQIKQALATDFPDSTTAEVQRATQVVVASNKDITKGGLASLGPLLEREGLSGHVDFLGIDQLWALAEQHLMPWLIADSLARARTVLLEIDPDYRAEASLTKEGVRYTIAPKHEGAASIKFNADPEFPDTEDGRLQRAAYAKFIRTGEVVSVDHPLVPLVNPPPVLKYLMPPAGQGPFELSMLPREPAGAMIFRIYAKSSIHEAEIPYIHFTTLHGGFVKVRATNEQQPIPLLIELEIDKETNESRFAWTLQPQNLPLYWALIYCTFAAALAEGASVELEDLHEGGISRVLTTKVGEVNGPTGAFLDFLRRARAIEFRTEQAIVIPNLMDVSEEDIRSVDLAERILSTGEILNTTATVNITFAPALEQLRNLIAVSKTGGGEMRIGRPSHTLPILGSPIDFGPIQAIFEKALIHPDDLLRVEEAVAEETKDEIPFRFVCAPGTHTQILFERWRPATNPKPRQSGGWEGQVRISEDFDAPLPPEIQAAFEGRG